MNAIASPMQRMTTIRVLWDENEERDRIHRFSRSMASRISEIHGTRDVRVTVHLGDPPPPTAKNGRVARRREEYAVWAHVACPVCGLAMPVNPRWQRIVDHYPTKDEHRYYGNPTYFCRGSNTNVRGTEAA